LREALAAADHDFVLREPAPKLKRLRDALRILQWRGLSRTARRGRRYLSVAATLFFVAAIAGILLNALAWQRSRHPAPLFSRAGPTVPAKEPRVLEMVTVPAARRPPAASPVQHSNSVGNPSAQNPPYEKPVLETPVAAHPRQAHAHAPPVTPHDGISDLLKAPPPLKTPPVQRARPASAAHAPSAPNKAVMAAQRALVKLGFVLKPDGVAGATTRRAVERYEHDHGLPARGVLTPALMRRLSTETGVTR
jgi:hypothetical protein